MAPHGKELSEDMKKLLLLYIKMAWAIRRLPRPWNSCSTVAKTIHEEIAPLLCKALWVSRKALYKCNKLLLLLLYSGLTGQVPLRTGLAMVDQRSWLYLGNRRMSAASIAAEVEGVGGQPVSAQTIRHTLHQIGLHGCNPRRKPLLKMMHKKAHKQFAEDKQTKDMDYWNHVLWSVETKINLFGSDGV